MAITKEVINTLRSRSIIRVVNDTAGSMRINLAEMSAAASETIEAASLTHVIATTDGWWSIYRGNDATGTLLLKVDSCDLPFTTYDIALANSSTSNVFVQNSGANGTLILQMTKTASYNPPLTGM